jgi:hypothetical protein
MIDARPHVYAALVHLLEALERDPETLARLGPLFLRPERGPSYNISCVRVSAEHAISDLISVLLGDLSLEPC